VVPFTSSAFTCPPLPGFQVVAAPVASMAAMRLRG